MRDFVVGDGVLREGGRGCLLGEPLLLLGAGSVVVGPYRDAEGHESHLLSTSGTGDWVNLAEDEWRFDCDAGALASLWLQVPDRLVPSNSRGLLEEWSQVTPISAGLVAPNGDLRVPPTECSAHLTESGFLYCLTEEAFAREAMTVEGVYVADDLHLLFERNRYVGWRLKSPEVRLASGMDALAPGQPDSELAEWLAEFWRLTSESMMDELLEGDLSVLEEQKSLLRVMTNAGRVSDQRQTLIEVLRETIEFNS